MLEQNILENKEDRERLIKRVDVLEKVKKLLLIPGFEAMTLRQVADYYEVEFHAIEMIYSRNTDELKSDGVCVKRVKDFLNSQYVRTEKSKYKNTFVYSNGMILTMPNSGLKVFPRRAILRVGMLLRDSSVAKEVRTQLLNIEEKSTNDVKIHSIKEEEKLLMNIALAYKSGEIDKLMAATSEYNRFQTRYIQELEPKAKIVDEMIKNDSSITTAITQKIKGMEETKNWNNSISVGVVELGESTKSVLIFIHNYINKHGISPSVREICEGTGLRSTSSVHSHVDKLNKLGFLAKNPKSPRHIRVNEEKYITII